MLGVRYTIQYLCNLLINYWAILCNRYWEKYLVSMNVSSQDSDGVWISLSRAFPCLWFYFFFFKPCFFKSGTGEISEKVLNHFRLGRMNAPKFTNLQPVTRCFLPHGWFLHLNIYYTKDTKWLKIAIFTQWACTEGEASHVALFGCSSNRRFLFPFFHSHVAGLHFKK